LAMRIIAGERRGVRLHPFRGTTVRPTGDRVREAIFNLVRDLEGAQVLDAYAGTGALGLEALSRGAERAVLVDSDARAVALARRNVEKVGLSGASVFNGTVEAHLRREAKRSNRYDLVLIDPPYTEAARAMRTLSNLLPPVLAGNARVVVETNRSLEPALPFEQETSRTYGSTRVTIFQAPS
jgi:16S rRNA (guanine966-N2)-methyltransferase